MHIITTTQFASTLNMDQKFEKKQLEHSLLFFFRLSLSLSNSHLELLRKIIASTRWIVQKERSRKAASSSHPREHELFPTPQKRRLASRPPGACIASFSCCPTLPNWLSFISLEYVALLCCCCRPE